VAAEEAQSQERKVWFYAIVAVVVGVVVAGLALLLGDDLLFGPASAAS
jgi:hypothetical protein